ncbi:MAG: hypothetical protein ACOH18_01135 [Candidatus Saccharimonadaceae bacterium]
MSATAPVNITSVPSRKGKTAFHLRDSVLALIPLFVAVFGIGLAVFIAFDKDTGVESSFWLGFSTFYCVAIAIYTMWWVSNPKTNKWPGFFLGVTDMAFLAALLIMFAVLPDSTFAWNKFGWGVLVAIIIGVVFGAIKVYGYLSRKLTK